MRVLMLPKPEPADAVTSGIGRYVGILEKHFGDDVEVFHLPGAPHEEDRRLFRPVEPIRSPMGGRSGGIRKLIPQSLRLLAGYVHDIINLAGALRPLRNKVDLIHVNRVGCEIQTIAAKLAGFRRIVATIHNLPGEDATAQHGLRRWIERLSFSCADQLISVSEATYEAWGQRIGLNRNKVTVIHNGIDVTGQGLPTKQDARCQLGVPENALVFGICARLHPMKGHSVLLAAFAHLLKEFEQKPVKPAKEGQKALVSSSSRSDVCGLMSDVSSCLLLIAGDGPEQANIEAKIKELGIADHVRMLGRIQNVMGFMRALDVHVLPSVTLESMPFSVVEAMFAGVPSIVSDVGGAKEVVQASNGGEVVPKGDVDPLAKGMLDWACDSLRRDAAGVRCVTYARENLTGAGMTEVTLNVYRKVL